MASFSSTYSVQSSPDDERQDLGGWVVRRNGRIFSRRATLGEVAALIDRCDRMNHSKWSVDRIAVTAGTSAIQIADRLRKYGRI